MSAGLTFVLIAIAAGLALLATRNRFIDQPSFDPYEPTPDPEPEPFFPTPTPTPVPAPIITPGPQNLPGGHEEWDNQIRYAASISGLPLGAGPLILKAIIEHESAHTWNPEVIGDYDQPRCPEVYARHPVGFRPGRGSVSTAGYCSLGLMQIHRYWHPFEARIYDLLDGNQNILAGAYLVANLWNSFGDWSRVLAAYNGGPDAGNAWPGVTSQVRNYVANVGGTFRRYAAAAGVVV